MKTPKQELFHDRRKKLGLSRRQVVSRIDSVCEAELRNYEVGIACLWKHQADALDFLYTSLEVS